MKKQAFFKTNFDYSAVCERMAALGKGRIDDQSQLLIWKSESFEVIFELSSKGTLIVTYTMAPEAESREEAEEYCKTLPELLEEVKDCIVTTNGKPWSFTLEKENLLYSGLKYTLQQSDKRRGIWVSEAVKSQQKLWKMTRMLRRVVYDEKFREVARSIIDEQRDECNGKTDVLNLAEALLNDKFAESCEKLQSILEETSSMACAVFSFPPVF